MLTSLYSFLFTETEREEILSVGRSCNLSDLASVLYHVLHAHVQTWPSHRDEKPGWTHDTHGSGGTKELNQDSNWKRKSGKGAQLSLPCCYAVWALPARVTLLPALSQVCHHNDKRHRPEFVHLTSHPF